MQTAQSRLLMALSALTARESRPAALQTAAAIAAGRLDDVLPPCALDAEILALAMQLGAIEDPDN
jgi:hypothetical protein